jgi:hypothetical protein
VYIMAPAFSRSDMIDPMLQLCVLLASSEKIYTYGNLLNSGRKETNTPIYTFCTSHHKMGEVLKFMLSAV